jgi:hypothetical protein
MQAFSLAPGPLWDTFLVASAATIRRKSGAGIIGGSYFEQGLSARLSRAHHGSMGLRFQRRFCVPLIALCIAAGNAWATEIYCFESSRKLKNICYVPGQVTSNGDLRASPLFKGGPRDFDKASVTIVVNCKTSVISLQDRQGTNVRSAAASDSWIASELSAALCAVKKTRQDETLRQ